MHRTLGKHALISIRRLHKLYRLTSHSANFKRVVCPAEITAKTNCIRNDDKVLAGEASAAQSLMSGSPTMAFFAAGILALISI